MWRTYFDICHSVFYVWHFCDNWNDNIPPITIKGVINMIAKKALLTAMMVTTTITLMGVATISALSGNDNRQIQGLANPDPSGAHTDRVLIVTDFVQQGLWYKEKGGAAQYFNSMIAFELQNKGGYGILRCNEIVTNIADGLFEYVGGASSQLSLKYRETHFDNTEWFFDSGCNNKIAVFPFDGSPTKVEIIMGGRTTGELEQGFPSHLSRSGNVYTLSDLGSSIASTLSPTEATRGKNFHIESIKYYYNC